jgi:DNA (cytosine-5)-methyltransferase 1
MRTMIDLFSGIGGFRLGFERAGFRCIGSCENDKFALESYRAMFDTKGEWFCEDIRSIKSKDIPFADCWTFGFPCQDISVAGFQRGVSAERSGLYFTVLDLVKGKEEKDKPRWLVAENVKNLLSIHACPFCSSRKGSVHATTGREIFPAPASLLPRCRHRISESPHLQKPF